MALIQAKLFQTLLRIKTVSHLVKRFSFPFADHMQQLCKNHFLRQLYRKIDGAVLWSQNERNLDCVITFQTHSILQRFMLRFDMLKIGNFQKKKKNESIIITHWTVSSFFSLSKLDCNDHLYVYDGAHAVGTHKVSKLTYIGKITPFLYWGSSIKSK